MSVTWMRTISCSIGHVFAYFVPVVEAVLLDELQQMHFFLVGPRFFIVKQRKAYCRLEKLMLLRLCK